MVFYMADGTTVSTAPKFTGSSYLDTASGNVGTILGVDDEVTALELFDVIIRKAMSYYSRSVCRGCNQDRYVQRWSV